MSLAFSLRVRFIPLFRDQHMNMNMNMISTNSSSLTVKCSRRHTTPTNLIGKIKDKCGLKFGDKSAVAPATLLAIDDDDIPSHLRLIDTLRRLGVDRYFRSEIEAILEDTYALWQRRDRDIFSDIATHALAFRLLRVEGYRVSSEELAPYADNDSVTIDVATVLELYRASHERMYDEETTLEKLQAWTTTFLNQQLLTNSIHDMKLHKQVEFYLNNYRGILERMEVKRNLELYEDIGHYQAADHRFFEELVAFARQDFNMCQAQHLKDLEQLQRWYADCRLDTQKFGRDVVRVANFLTSAIFCDPEMSDARLAFAKHIVLTTRVDDFFDHGGPREEAYEIVELVKEWKEKPSSEYGSEEVEVLFTAVYKTVNELAEKAHIELGRSVKDILIKLWVEVLSVFKIELDVWSDDTPQSFDEYISVAAESIVNKICIVMSLPFLGIKLSDEMLQSEECAGLCWHVSVAIRLLNDVQTNEKERMEKTKNSVGILVEEAKRDGVVVSEEEVSGKIAEMVEHNRRRLMQIVYERDTILPRKCKDVFMNVSGMGYYLYSTTYQFTSPRQQMMEDMKSLLYQPFKLHKKSNLN